MSRLACALVVVILSCSAQAALDLKTLSSGDTRVVITLREGQPCVESFDCTGLTDTHKWTTAPVSLPLVSSAWVQNAEVSLHWRFFQAQDDVDAGTFTITFRNDTPSLELRSVWRARPGRGPVEHWLEIKNESEAPVAIPAQDSLCLRVTPKSEEAALWWIKRGGGNASTQGGVFSEPVKPGLDLALLSNCEDGASPVPWLALQDGEYGGVYLGWEFSGLGRIRAQATPEGVMLHVGLTDDFRTDIAPGETFVVPPAFVGCYAGGLDDGAYALHRWIIEKLRPAVPEDIPDPTLAYNLYLDAGGNEAKEADVLRSAAFCADIGFETFMPDAMWFPETGDWRWDPARFPGGVQPIEAFVHGHGMRLALWCAWTNGGVSEHPDALSVRGPAGHPDWFNNTFGPEWQPGPFYGAQLCLACPEARQWEMDKTKWLVGNHKLDYLKHDCGPIVTKCFQTSHRHHYGTDTSYWAAMGYYAVQEDLRRAYPHLVLENCSGGGHIKDFGVIQRTHYTVTTDTLSNLPDRQSLYDSTYAFPPILLQAYTYERAYNVPGDDPEPYLWRSAMMSAWQIDPTNTLTWTPEQRDLARQHAQIYKDWVRPMLKDIQVHHILPRPDGAHWDGLFYWSAPLSRGTLYVFRPDAPEAEYPVVLKGLDAEKEYRIWSQDASVAAGVVRGEALMRDGLRVRLSDRFTSDLVYVQDATLPEPAELESAGAFSLEPAQVEADFFTATATLHWKPSAHAQTYRVLVSKTADLADPIVRETTVQPTIVLSDLPASATLYWRVQAVAWGGVRDSDGAPGAFTTPEHKPHPGVTFVSDMPWATSTAGAGNSVHRDTNYGGTAIHIANKMYPKGVWTHAFEDNTPADVVIDIAGKGFAVFAADAGVESSGGGGSVQFQVLLDNTLAAESPVMKPGQAHTFRVEVGAAKQVTLRVLNGGDGHTCDHAAWGYARFIATGAEDPFQAAP